MLDLFLPNIAYASVDSFMANVGRLIINPIIVFLFALATMYFIFGVFQFITNAENDEKRAQGKLHMIWGIIGLVIMIGVWTILNIVLATFNISSSEINPEEGTVKLKEYNPSIR